MDNHVRLNNHVKGKWSSVRDLYIPQILYPALQRNRIFQSMGNDVPQKLEGLNKVGFP